MPNALALALAVAIDSGLNRVCIADCVVSHGPLVQDKINCYWNGPDAMDIQSPSPTEKRGRERRKGEGKERAGVGLAGPCLT